MKKWTILFVFVLAVLCLSVCDAEGVIDPAAVAVGKTVTFGHFEQDNNPENGPEPIKWTVLDIQDGKALLLSRYGLDAREYFSIGRSVTWKDCALRAWLNEDFLQTAFSETERSIISLTEVDNSPSQGYSGWDTDGGDNTRDWVFLLSYREVHKYLKVEFHEKKGSDENLEARVQPTDYAVARGASPSGYYETEDGAASADWWLRSPGSKSVDATKVDEDGSFDTIFVINKTPVVRPALWIWLDAGKAEESGVAEGQSLETFYRMAKEFCDAGKYDDAFELLYFIRGYKDTDTLLKTNEHFSAYSLLISDSFGKVGDTIRFGSYWQDNDLADGKELIEWTVLDIRDGKALLLSRYGIHVKPYNTEKKNTTWEKSSLRAWLNDEFLKTAFNEEEQAAILLTDVDNSASQGYSGWETKGGKNTKDRIFLLSCQEARRYLGVRYYKKKGSDQNMAARTRPTDYTYARGTFPNFDYHTEEGPWSAWWWLRSPGSNRKKAAYVDCDGSLKTRSVEEAGLVRPALWIDLNSDFY